MEFDLFKSQYIALVSESIEELKEQERWTQTIIDENRNLKFRLSQLLNRSDEYKSRQVNIEFAWNEITQAKAALESENERLLEKKKFGNTNIRIIKNKWPIGNPNLTFGK
jgi:hypothetical protein